MEIKAKLGICKLNEKINIDDIDLGKNKATALSLSRYRIIRFKKQAQCDYSRSS